MLLTEVLGIPNVLRRNAEILKSLKMEIERALEKRAQETATLAKEKAPDTTGNLRENITVDRPQALTRNVHTGNAIYAECVEFGTSPHWPPAEPLKRWALRVLSDEKAGYAIQRKIAAAGTEEQPFFRPAIEAVRPKYLADMARLAKQVSG